MLVVIATLFSRRRFAQEIAKWIEGKVALDRDNKVFANVEIRSAADAEALNAALLHVDEHLSQRNAQDESVARDLHTLIGFLQNVVSRNAVERIRSDGLPTLDRILAVVGDDNTWENESLFAFKQFVAYGYEPGIERIAGYARNGTFADNYLWSIVFAGFRNHPDLGVRFVTGLGGSLPSGFCGIAYLDFVNALCRDGHLKTHPFDTDAGGRRLTEYLEDRAHSSYGVSACAALPFVDKDRRASLLGTALAHTDPMVRLEAAWAIAASGDEEGLRSLSLLARNPTLALRAIQYLEELDAVSWIPEGAKEPVFRAQAEMADWLTHPSEFGRPPARVWLVDRRRLFWPPAGEEIDAFLIRYRYDDGDAPDVGVGMVGSVTFALFGETDLANLPPEDLYGLHCCWELQCAEDPAAPEHRTAETGRRILAAANPGMGF